MNIKTFILNKLTEAMIIIGASANHELDVRQSNKIQPGDYQINGIMSIAKKLGKSPYKLAQQVVQHLDLNDLASQVVITDPGFINIVLSEKWLAQQITQRFRLRRLGISMLVPSQTIVVDYSSPNVAKEMHVGHLRSTIIGDAMVRTLSFLGHNVIRANHIGDWGTQFGMLIAYMKEKEHKDYTQMELNELENIYRKAKKNYDEDEKFAELARKYVVQLQKGDEYCRNVWRILIDISINHNQKIYDRLNVSLTCKDIMGESLYNDMLPSIVSDLCNKGLATISNGATVIVLDEFINRTGESMGIIIQKKDGGYLYATTDIACVKYRCETLHADRILYYIDARQNQHLKQVWTIARKAGYVPKDVSLEHHAFGMMLSNNGRPFKTRKGNTIKLMDLLDEAVDRAFKLVSQKNPKMSKNQLLKLAEIIGISSVKYADLSKNRTANYIFNWDKMLAFEGNTAPYIQYAYTRAISIFRKAKIDFKNLRGEIVLSEHQERCLAICLLQFEETIMQVAQDGTPHIMCSYLYELASLFSIFYEHCPMLSINNKILSQSRLQLTALTAKTLKQGLKTLGIKTIEHM
ncbi:ArgS protein [Candidatus Pantoea carbekii]|uniref:Arginine--tRNA ligase n=1 Tax=Candidatus Pantoea carbekii TaxID=1235990 RepID=U3U332_9GAMM|nr:ArgS protein [Candidatus Pantoea carbekii]